MTRPIGSAVSIGACLLGAHLLGACGGSKHPAPDSVGTGSGTDAAVIKDAGSPAPPDAGSHPQPPEQKPPPVMIDAGHDAGMPAPAPSEEDAGPHCTGRECRAMGDDCHAGYCDTAAGECKLEPKPDGTACGSRTLDNCTAPDSCQAGTCVPNDTAAGVPCGDQAMDCRFDDQCDGHGTCSDNGLWPQGMACGDHSDSACDHADTCDASGVCQKRYASVDAPCGDQGQPCKYDDLCDGLGQCIDSGDIPNCP